MDKLELQDEVPFTYDEEGDCIYCGNMKEIENQNLVLMQQVKELNHQNDVLATTVNMLSPSIMEIYHKNKLIEKLTNENECEREMRTKQLKIINHYGIDPQIKYLIQECAELIVAITKFEKNNFNEITIDGLNDVIDEMADVENLIEQIKLRESFIAYGVEKVKKYKVDRQLIRISKE